MLEHVRDAGDVRPFVRRADVERDRAERDGRLMALDDEEFHPVLEIEFLDLLFEGLRRRLRLRENEQRERRENDREEKRSPCASVHTASFRIRA